MWIVCNNNNNNNNTRSFPLLAILSLSAIAVARAKTAVLFGANGSVGIDVLRALVNHHDHFFEKVILVGRRFPPEVMDVLPSSTSSTSSQSSTKLPEVVFVEVEDLSNVDRLDHEELAASTDTTEANSDVHTADACFVAVGAAMPQLSDFHDWHNVEVTMAGSIARMCGKGKGKLHATSITIFTAIEAESDPTPFADHELVPTGHGDTTSNTGGKTPIGWWPVLVNTVRVMGLKEKSVLSNSNVSSIPFVRIFQPSNIITKELRYGWLDWTLFKFHAIFDEWLPTRYHSVTTELLANAMVQDAVNVLSGNAGTNIADGSSGDGDGAIRFTYGDFVRIVGEDAGVTHGEL